MNRSNELYPWLLLGMLVLCNIFNVIDQSIPFLIIESIRKDIPMSDLQIGAIGSLMYTLTYAVFGILLARLADRSSRTRVIGMALAGWSVLTGLGGLATSYLVFALCRVGVAVGESVLHPTAPSLIADTFKAERRRFALSLFFAGQMLGNALGHAVGGWFSDHFGWRWTLAAFAAPGAVLGAVFIRLRDPERKGDPDGVSPASFFKAVSLLWRYRSFRWLTVSAGTCMFAAFSVSRFLPIFLIRSLSMSTQAAGLKLAAVFAVGGILGNILVGLLTDVLAKRDERWNMWVISTAMLGAFAFYLAMWRLRDANYIYLLLIPGWTCATMFMTPSFHVASQLGAGGMRALAPSILMFFMFAVGASLGPLSVGALSDALRPGFGINSVPVALQVTTCAFVLAALGFWRAARHLPADLLTAGAAATSERPAGVASQQGEIGGVIR